MKITSKNKVIADKVELAKSTWKKAIGLMFRKSINSNFCFLMEFKKQGVYSIWMLFMRFPIDLVFLDSNKTVVTKYENVQPLSLNSETWKVYKPTKPVKYILELKAGKAEKISLGDIISF